MTDATGASGANKETIGQLFQNKRLWAWFSDRVTNYYDGQSERGQDYSTAYGTPVGVPVGGKILRIVHNNNAINDVVELQDSTGAVWLYQHITATCRVGQILGAGGIVGTENGLPIDQYSTGPHIEVRYCPPGQWKLTTDSWDEPWINPKSIFAALANQPVGSIDNSAFNFTGSGFSSALDTINRTTTHIAPGASVAGVLAAWDTALELQNPFQVKIDGPTDITFLGVDTGIENPLSDARAVFQGAQDVFYHMVQNTSALVVRAAFIAIGVVIIMTIGYQYIQPAIKGGVDKIGGTQGVAQIAEAFV